MASFNVSILFKTPPEFTTKSMVKHPKVGVVAQGQKPEKPIYKKNTLVYHANE